MTTKDILKETLGSLKFPDAAWDELAEKIDSNSRRPDDEMTQIGDPNDCASDCVGPDCEGCRKFVPKKIREEIKTPDDIKEFVGKAQYDDHGQLIFRGADKDNLQQFLDVRGWGAIQNMGFKTEQEMMDFQDKVGRWVTDVINNNLK